MSSVKFDVIITVVGENIFRTEGIFPSWLKKQNNSGFRAVLASAIHRLRESSTVSGSLMRPDHLKKRIKRNVSTKRLSRPQRYSFVLKTECA